MKKVWFPEAVRIMMVFLFTYTAASKLSDLTHFRLLLGKSPLVYGFAGTISWALPATEFLLALALCFKCTKAIAMDAAFFLMSLFTVYVFTMIHYSVDLPCSCGGVISAMSWPLHLAFNVVVTLLCGAAIVYPEPEKLLNINKQRIAQ